MTAHRIIAVATLCLITASAQGAALYLTSLDVRSDFAVYDTQTDSWTDLTPFETGAQMAVSATGELYAWNRPAQAIQRYNPISDTWSNVIAPPPGASGNYGNLEITNDGRFLYSETNSSTLHYTDNNGVWQTHNLGFSANAVGDYDPLTGNYVIQQFTTGNAYLIDVDSLATTAFTNGPQNNGERARFGAAIGDDFYFQFANLDIHAYDLTDNALAALDVSDPLVNPFFSSSAADRVNGGIYVGALNGTNLQYFDIGAGSLTTLTSYFGNVGNHSSLALAQAVQDVPEPTSLALLGLGLAGLGMRRKKAA